MATDVESSLLQENIEEYIHDDNKVVTCKWLSLTHSININTAKRALHTYVDTQRNKGGNDDVNVTYFVAGLGKSKDGDLLHKCAVVPETELDVVKKSLSTVTSCHIFSVQKAKLKDYTALYMTDYEIIKNNLDKCNSFSSIKCPWVALKANLPSPKKQQVQKPETKENTTPDNVSSNKDKAAGAKAPGKKAEPKGSIASMFASSAKRDAGSDKSSKPASKTNTSPKGKATEKKGGMMAFMSKKTEKPTKEDASVKETKETRAEIEPPKSKVTSKDSKVEPKRKKAQAVDSDEEGPDKKKRRRIRTDLFDSSDEGDNGDRSEGEEPEEMEPEEEEVSINVIPSSQEEDKGVEESNKADEQLKEPSTKQDEPTSNTSSGKKRKRTKKVVTKHYQDEDGFMVTKKETVWESETDDETEDPPAKEEATAKKANTNVGKAAPKNTTKAEPKGRGASKKTAVSPQKNKQTSLMSFFKKK